MLGWTLIDIHQTKGRTFQRPLDASELSFFWDGLFNGTSDSVQHHELHLSNGSQDAHLFSTANIVRAWLSTKRRYPLLGATVRGHSAALHLTGTTNTELGGSDGNCIGLAPGPHFVVREQDLYVLRPREIVFGWVTSAEEVKRRAGAILDGPRPLSEEMLVQLYVFRETERAEVLHLLTLIAHCITDMVANSTFARCLFDTLARGVCSDSYPAQIPLEDRLAMAIPSLRLEPAHLSMLSPAKRRWRRVIGVVIFQLRMAKRQGGHTLPCRITRSTPHLAARSGRVSTSLTHSQSAAVIAHCRLHDLTFGNAILPLAQVAMTRVLYRRYLRGEISEEEWAYRKKQPHIIGGPLNLRPYLDDAWFNRGGGGEFMLSIGFFFYELPFMTLGGTAKQHDKHDRERVLLDGAPPFSDLLTFDRFLHRAGLVKKQARAFFNHPLFFEIVCAMHQLRIEQMRLSALQWVKRGRDRGENDVHGHLDDNEVLPVMKIPAIWAHGGASVGSVDSIFPSEYPIPPAHPLSPHSLTSHPVKAGYLTPPSSSPSFLSSTSEADTTPKITVEQTGTHLHVRPSELYLGASSLRGQLNMFVFYDGNVFEDEIVREWLGEVKAAVLWYLGQTRHRSGRTGRGGSVRANL